MRHPLLVLSIVTFLSCGRSVEFAGGGNEEITGWVGRSVGIPAVECLVTLRRIDEFRTTDTGAVEKTFSDEDGNFHFDRIMSGKYSVEFNDNDTLGKLVTITVTTGKSLPLTEYVEPYGALYGWIDSSVMNASAGLTVYAVEIKRGVPVDTSGRFGFGKLPPGRYTLLVDDADSMTPPLTDTSAIQVSRNDTVFIVNVGGAAGPRIVTFPEPPAGVVVRPAGDDIVRLTWDADSNVSVFRILRSDGDTLHFTTVGNALVNAYSDSGLASDTKYYYRLFSVNQIGESPYTRIDSALTYPARPTGLEVKATVPGAIGLAWDTVPSGCEFLVYREESASGIFAVADTTRSCQFTDTAVVAGTGYCYTVAVFNTSGESVRSDTVCAEAAVADSTFEKYLSAGAALEEIRAVVQQQDSGYLLGGKANAAASDSRGDGWLLKVSSSGEEVWSHLFEDFVASEIQSVISLPDGGYLACGGAGTGSDFSGYSGWAIRFNRSGTIVWSKTYPLGSSGMFNAVTPASDGNYLLCGNGLQADGSAGSSGWIVKIDDNGDTLRSKSVSDAGSLVAFNSILQISGDEIIICGVCRFDTSSIESGLFLRADSAMKSYTCKEYKVEGYACGFVSFIQTDGPGFVFSGFTRTGADTAGGWLVKTDSNGNSLWSKTYPVRNQKAFCAGHDGSYLIGGSEVVKKIDGDGNEVWSETVTDKAAECIQRTSDGGYIVAGRTSATFKQGDQGDGWIMKFQENKIPLSK